LASVVESSETEGRESQLHSTKEEKEEEDEDEEEEEAVGERKKEKEMPGDQQTFVTPKKRMTATVPDGTMLFIPFTATGDTW